MVGETAHTGHTRQKPRAPRDGAPGVELFGDQREDTGLRVSGTLLKQLDPVRTYIRKTENLTRQPSRPVALGWLVKRGFSLSRSMHIRDIADPLQPLSRDIPDSKMVYTRLQIDEATWGQVRLSIIADKTTIPVRITTLAVTALQIIRPVMYQETRS